MGKKVQKKGESTTLPDFYQTLFKSTVFVLFQEILQNECFVNL